MYRVRARACANVTRVKVTRDQVTRDQVKPTAEGQAYSTLNLEFKCRFTHQPYSYVSSAPHALCVPDMATEGTTLATAQAIVAA